MTHSKTPWKVENVEDALATYLVNEDSENICMCSWTVFQTREEAEANAAFIVKAVNNYERMRGLLANVADILKKSDWAIGDDIANYLKSLE